MFKKRFSRMDKAGEPVQHRSKEEILQSWILAIGTLLISGAVAGLTRDQLQIAQETASRELRIAQENRVEDERRASDEQQHEIMSNYLEEMTNLLVEQDLKTSVPGDDARTVARSMTLNAVRRLSPERKGQLLKFLYEAGLINTCSENPVPLSSSEICDTPSVIDLDEVALVRTRFNDKDPPLLTGVNLAGVDLSNAFLKEVGLAQSVMTGATLENTKLSGAVLYGSQMQGVKMEGADLARASLFQADLSQADLRNVNFNQTNLKEADLNCARLHGANLEHVDLKEFETANFQAAEYDAETTFPPGFNPEAFNMSETDAGEPTKDTCIDGKRIPLP